MTPQEKKLMEQIAQLERYVAELLQEVNRLTRELTKGGKKKK